ncbi:MAG: hypothetical protein NTZ94_16245 [Verrucomicrobia bacterium]|nr:hypothetical protein [Verrucomicrobiota bacterium]
MATTISQFLLQRDSECERGLRLTHERAIDAQIPEGMLELIRRLSGDEHPLFSTVAYETRLTENQATRSIRTIVEMRQSRDATPLTGQSFSQEPEAVFWAAFDAFESGFPARSVRPTSAKFWEPSNSTGAYKSIAYLDLFFDGKPDPLTVVGYDSEPHKARFEAVLNCLRLLSMRLAEEHPTLVTYTGLD